MTPARRRVVDLIAVALLLGVTIAGFAPTFAHVSYLLAAVGGLAIGMGIAVLCAWRGWGILATAGLTVVAYLLFAGPLALPSTTLFGLPTLDTLLTTVFGAVTSWKELLTTVAPVSADGTHHLVPFMLLLVGGVLTTSLALRARSATWALLPAVLVLAGQIALGLSSPAWPIVQGIVFALVAVVWAAVREATDPRRAVVQVQSTPEAARGARTRRLAGAAAVLVVAVGAGGAASAVMPDTGPRYVLRDVVIPPFDVHAYPSPLQSWRGLVRDFRSDPLFTVDDLPAEARVRLATMDAYTGTVYDVSATGTGASGAFQPIRGNMSPTIVGTDERITIRVEGLASYWLPTVGATTTITYAGGDAEDLRRSSYFNDATSTAVTTRGVSEGDVYTLDTVMPKAPSDAALDDAVFAPFRMPKQAGVPEGVAALASDAISEADTPIEQVRALQDWLHTDGFFSHGLEDDKFSMAGHGASRIESLFGAREMIGDDEQYAVAMALLAREIGIPARVVMGWHRDLDDTTSGEFVATGDNMHAWVEVAFADIGWVTFDPTPPKDKTPTDPSTKPRADPKPQVLQPPPPPQEPVELPTLLPDDRESEDGPKEEAFDFMPIVLIAGGSLLAMLVLLGPLITVIIIKAVRRRRRRAAQRPSDRLSGGWDEVVDRAVDLRLPVVAGATRSENAGAVGVLQSRPSDDATSTDAARDSAAVQLAAAADAGVFGPGEPSDADVDRFWAEVDDVVGGMRRSASPWRRLRAKISLRSLLGRHRIRSEATSHNGRGER